MNENLPIKININQTLVIKFSKIKSVCNKLEAQFNFQTLTANWYGDEENILTIQLGLETAVSLIEHHEVLQKSYNEELSIKQLSDDVICYINEPELQLQCLVALTDSEIALLESQPKLLTSFIQAKLHKVLNIIAEQRSLTKI